jgi:hypothetical protein
MVSGKPYISTKSATTKPEKAPKLRHSSFVLGLKKLNANTMKTAEFSRTNDQRPYAGVCCGFMTGLLARAPRARGRGARGA